MPPTNCPECKSYYETKPQKCPSCGYPFEVDGEDRSKLIAEEILRKRSGSQGKSAIRTVRIMLWVIAIINLAYGLYIKSYSPMLANLQLLATVVLVGLSMLTYSHPIIAVILSFVGFLFIYILVPIITGNAYILFNGFVVKLLILSILTYGLVNVLREEKSKKIEN